jgi:hypothetical protein
MRPSTCCAPIADLELPEPVPEQLREVDARRRALEMCDELAGDEN